MAVSRIGSDFLNMTPERWQQIRDVFEQAEPLSALDREPYLDQACAGDPELRREVDSLLKAASRAGSAFMDRPAADLMQPLEDGTAGQTRVGRRLGPYEIVAEIGRGGMGEVYRAVRVDGQFDQQVAIKLVRAGMGSAFVLERFLHERQILATLDHPNIARLLDGGTTDGVPYLVMELIEGERIDAYCQARRLSVSDRLRLFLEVCSAVQYAHQRLVIHRDIKPGNILVTTDGAPKLLDFGIAKIVDSSGDSETTVARPMTPEYASPEQIRGETITTATDVYSLGVVLYQLLTGRSPYRTASKTAHGWSHAITETDPQRPSTVVMSPARVEENAGPSAIRAEEIASDRETSPAKLRRRLAGDVDSMLMMALRKEPERRYGSVQQLADDITRHLNGLPVISAKGSWSYTARKFVARHRAAVAGTALVILALLAGIATTERQARIARTERARAQKRFDDVRQFSNSLIFEIHDALEDIPGTTAARNLLLDRAVQYLDRVAKDADGDSELQRELAFGYQRLATVQGDATVSNVGQVSAAEISSQKATALFETVARANPANTGDQLNVAMIHRQKALSDAYYPDGRPEIERALAITDGLMRTDGANSKVRMERAMELQVLAASLSLSGEHNKSAANYRQSVEIVQAIAQSEPGYRNMPERIAKAHVQLGFELAYTSAIEAGQKEIEAGVAAYDSAMKPGTPPGTVRDLAQSRIRLGFVQAIRGDFASAGKNFQRAHDALEPLARSDPQNVTFKADVLSTDFQKARLQLLEGRSREAETQLSRVIDGFKNLNSEEDSGPGDGVLYTWLGEAQLETNKFDQALVSYKQAAEALEKDVQYDDGKCGIVTDYIRMGDTYLKMNRLSDAQSAYRAALAKSNLAFAREHEDLPALYPIAAAYSSLGNLQLTVAAGSHSSEERERERSEGCAALARSREIQRQFPAMISFSPSDFPVPPLKVADASTVCNGRAP
jgi:non-specific serine/threonine protein kinase/serine/threonine-protein kinase